MWELSGKSDSFLGAGPLVVSEVAVLVYVTINFPSEKIHSIPAKILRENLSFQEFPGML